MPRVVLVLIPVAVAAGLTVVGLAFFTEVRRPPPEAVPVAVAPFPTLGAPRASAFAKLALANVGREYPNHPSHVVNGPADFVTQRANHPAFYGSYDWHSSVHGHWMLVRLLKRFPELPEGRDVRATLNAHLTADNIKSEAAYFGRPNAKSFERTYGWAWLLKLTEELRGWDDVDGKAWAANLRPLEDALVARYLDFLPKQTYPVRTGVHPNTAFGLLFAHDYARAAGHEPLRKLVEDRATSYYAADANYTPAAWEPGGTDFFSPALMEADLMRRVLPPAAFADWFGRFLPDAAKGGPKGLFAPAEVSDRTDPQLVHLDGLNLSRAWAMRGIAAALPADHPARAALQASAARHAEAGLRHVSSGNYEGEHWLASFAVYLLTTPD